MTNAVLREKPDAGNPHVRFDEGEVALAATPRRGSLLYKIRQPFVAASLLAMSASCVLCAFADVKYELPAMHILVDGKSVQAKHSKICLAGKKGYLALSVTTPSRVTFPLGGGAMRLDSAVGVDCRTTVDSAADFRVLAPDGKVLWEKKGVRKGVEIPVHVDLAGLDSVTLETSGEDGILAAWARPYFRFADGKYPPHDVRNHSPQLGILTPPESPTPRINGPVVYGVRPGHPIIYRIPVTGERPVKVKVESSKLKVECGRGKEGLFFDPEIRIITGSIKEPGEYTVTIIAENAAGKAEKTLTFKVGDKIALTPPLGWNSWNCFGPDVTAEKIRVAADALLSSGLAEHGYSYINIDDFWQRSSTSKKEALQGPERSEDGTVMPNANFPDMKGLADYIHAKGFKAGLYSSPGPTTCGGCTGSYGYEAHDAKTYADWGYDYLKHDWCSYESIAAGSGLERAMKPYRIMGNALREQNRDIVFSLCQYGKDDVSAWGEKVGAQCWRVVGDIFDIWGRISYAANCLKPVWMNSAPGSWNDADMLCVGCGIWNEFKGSRLAPNEQYTHISLWALAASPLLIGCDLEKLDDFTRALLCNDEVIDIDQDPLGKAAACIVDGENHEIWARPLVDGSIAVGLFNKGTSPREIVFDMAAAGMEGEWKVRDCWRQKDEGLAKGEYKASVYGHATHLVRFIPGNGKLVVTDIRDSIQFLEEKAVPATVSKASGDCEGCERRRQAGQRALQ